MRTTLLLSLLCSATAFCPGTVRLGHQAPAGKLSLRSGASRRPALSAPFGSQQGLSMKASMLDHPVQVLFRLHPTTLPRSLICLLLPQVFLAQGDVVPNAGAAPAAMAESNVLTQILGTDSLPLTIMATVTLLLGVVTTIGVGALTYYNWKDDQSMKALQDPNSAESRELFERMRELDNPTSTKKAKGSKAINEINEIQKSTAKPPPQNIPSEPGNRDARRNAAKRRRAEEKQAAKREAEVAARKQGDPGLSALPEDSEANKSFLDGIFK